MIAFFLSGRSLRPHFSWCFSGLVLLLLIPSVSAQGRKSDYERAKTYPTRVRNLVFRDQVKPNWFDADQKLWYRVKTGIDSHEYVLVDALAGKRMPVFDHDNLSRILSQELKRKVDVTKLKLAEFSISPDAKRCEFRYAGRDWSLSLPTGNLISSAKSGSVGAREGLPAEMSVVRSNSQGERTPICFKNRLDKVLDIYWVMSNGDLRQYGSVGAGSERQISTFAGDSWLLKDMSGRSVAVFVAAHDEEFAIIDDKTTPPQTNGAAQAKSKSHAKSSDPARRYAGPNRSPDQKWSIAIRDSNVWLRDLDTGEERKLTDDGSTEKVYQGRVWWSPDSSHFVVMRLTPGLKRTIHLIESAPRDSIHAKLLTMSYAKPGDRIDQQRPVLFSLAEHWHPRLVDNTDFSNPYSTRDLAWKSDSLSFSFLHNERGHQRLALVSVDAASAKAKLMIDENPETFVCYSSKSYFRRLNDTNELIWMSERSGWNHLYLLDGDTGVVKRPLTVGNWVVRKVLGLDSQAREIDLEVSGLDAGQDPYYRHLIRVDLDTGNLVRLTAGDGDHTWEYSPDRKYLLDRYSRVDMPTVTVLRDAVTGKQICMLEQGDMTQLVATGWQPPERFVAKGRDGETDIHGIIVRPTNFDRSKKYPVLEQIYAGPHSSFVPKSFGLQTQLYSMAELGFIVVKMDGMGTSNRSKAFHDVCWKNLGDSGFPDRIAWIQAAAQKRPEMNLERVGIWGGSAGGQSAMRALLAHGEFYHAAVADCGCHDNRVDKIWWNEQWMGWPIGPHYKQQSNVTQAHRLQGDLMLIWGELDRNVDPASTMQVVDALIKANKDFVQLIVPGAGHGAAGHPYARRRQADFFVRKLWEREPRSE
ncbi:prolyl oligopeptidase family serine peptidase [Rubripirellula sp.]|nr:prolyl oligopeptidase family serine peptidase [Rubripirellula sp.]MDB4644723.1 prolyl oligopeptidase family serine peptidase [Rubripirellula sp.]